MLLWHPETLVKCIRLEEHIFMGTSLIPIMREFCFPLASIFLKDKSNGAKIVPVIFAYEPHFMVRVKLFEDGLLGIIDNRTKIRWIKVIKTVQEVVNVIVVRVTTKTTKPRHSQAPAPVEV